MFAGSDGAPYVGLEARMQQKRSVTERSTAKRHQAMCGDIQTGHTKKPVHMHIKSPTLSAHGSTNRALGGGGGGGIIMLGGGGRGGGTEEVGPA